MPTTIMGAKRECKKLHNQHQIKFMHKYSIKNTFLSTASLILKRKKTKTRFEKKKKYCNLPKIRVIGTMTMNHSSEEF